MDLEIGQRVQVRRMRDRVAKSLASRLGKTGIVKDLKLLDGQNIGALVTFESDQYTTWFFEDELRVIE
ncbi:MAG: cytochrome B6 [Phormidesmis priestleyi]|uniref:Cytochrome B6 n=1 Tax=Phormidesmis priestleyi TaxID=268141 RepID=A0A2W4YY90_9CYAN|nr:MAG: cytochrome B6 [Phormidesmis priestleyi]